MIAALTKALGVLMMAFLVAFATAMVTGTVLWYTWNHGAAVIFTLPTVALLPMINLVVFTAFAITLVAVSRKK